MMKLTYANTIQKLSFVSVLFFVFWLPLFEGFLPTIFGVWIGLWILEGKFKTRFQSYNFKSGWYIALFVYFLLSLIAVLYSSNQDKAWFDVQQKIALLVFPVLLTGMSPYFWKNIRWVFWAFIIGLAVASFYDIVYAIQASFSAGEAENIFRYWVYEKHENINFLSLIGMRMSYFSYGYFSQFMHPSYFSMYLIFGLPLIHHLYKTRSKPKPLDKMLYFLLGLYFVFLVYLLQSTAGFISLSVVLLSMLINESRILKKNKVSFYAFGFILSLFILLFLASINTNKVSDFKEKFTEESISNSSSIRLQIWKNTYCLWIENPFLGAGPSDIREILKTKFIEEGAWDYSTGNFNMHNQFLESLIGLGIFGLFVLLSLFYFLIQKAIQEKRGLLLFLSIIILSNFFFESVLNRQAGLFFFLFFLSLLALKPKQTPTIS